MTHYSLHLIKPLLGYLFPLSAGDKIIKRQLLLIEIFQVKNTRGDANKIPHFRQLILQERARVICGKGRRVVIELAFEQALHLGYCFDFSRMVSE